MHDYMRALQQRFFRVPRCEDLRGTVEDTCGEFLKRMSEEDKRKLLLIVDSMDAIRDEVLWRVLSPASSWPGESVGSWKQMASTPSMKRR